MQGCGAILNMVLRIFLRVIAQLRGPYLVVAL